MENNSQIWQRYLKVERLEIAKNHSQLYFGRKKFWKDCLDKIIQVKNVVLYNIREILKDRHIIWKNTSKLYKLKISNIF